MKAEYILNAISAMQKVETLNPFADPGPFGAARAELSFARIQLENRSGLKDVEINIEQVPT